MKNLALMMLLCLASCLGECQESWVTYRLVGGGIYRVSADGASAPQDISSALDALSVGDDIWLNISPNGAWLLIETERFDPNCAGWACLAVVDSDLSQAEVISVDSQVIHPEGFSAVDSTGNLVVYPYEGPSHQRDIFAVRRDGGIWQSEVNLTSASSYTHNFNPALSDDASTIVFECGDVGYGPGTSICQVGTDGSGFQVVLAASDETIPNYLHHPDYAPGGDIVFEGDDGGEALWRMVSGSGSPVKISSAYNNDNSPCVLPDGRIASLWLGRPGGPSLHELKLMSSDGAAYDMLLTNEDVFDIGIGCGGDSESQIFADDFDSGLLTQWSESLP